MPEGLVPGTVRLARAAWRGKKQPQARQVAGPSAPEPVVERKR
jgi:hypothetical protein